MHKLCGDKVANLWLNEVLQESVNLIVEKCFGLPLTHIILTGSLSRGEASVKKTKDGYRLEGDIEFLLVSNRNYRLGRVTQKCNLIKFEVREHLNLKFKTNIEIDLGVVRKRYFSKDLKPSIFTYDLTLNYILVFGPPIKVKRPSFNVASIPKVDALELLLNRTVELMILQYKGDVYRLNYQYVKIVLDLCGSLLAFTGNYVSNYAKRPEAVKKLFLANNDFVYFVDADKFFIVLGKALRWKLDINSSNELSIIEEEKKMIENWLMLAIIWELRKLTKCEKDNILELCTRFEKNGSIFYWARLWAKIMYYSTTAESGPSFSYLLRNFFRYNPRNRIYIGNLLFYFSFQLETAIFANKAEQLLKIFSERPDDSASVKKAHYLWYHYIRGR